MGARFVGLRHEEYDWPRFYCLQLLYSWFYRSRLVENYAGDANWTIFLVFVVGDFSFCALQRQTNIKRTFVQVDISVCSTNLNLNYHHECLNKVIAKLANHLSVRFFSLVLFTSTEARSGMDFDSFWVVLMCKTLTWILYSAGWDLICCLGLEHSIFSKRA